MAGPLSVLADAERVADLCASGVSHSGLALALVALVDLAGEAELDEVVVELAPPARLTALHVDPEALRRRIDVLDSLQATFRHAARASGLRRADVADAALTRMASRLEDLWSLIRRPDASELWLCASAQPYALAEADAEVHALTAQGIAVKRRVVLVPDAQCPGCQPRRAEALRALAAAPVRPETVLLDASLLPPADRPLRARGLRACLAQVGTALLDEAPPAAETQPATAGRSAVAVRARTNSKATGSKESVPGPSPRFLWIAGATPDERCAAERQIVAELEDRGEQVTTLVAAAGPSPTGAGAGAADSGSPASSTHAEWLGPLRRQLSHRLNSATEVPETVTAINALLELAPEEVGITLRLCRQAAVGQVSEQASARRAQAQARSVHVEAGPIDAVIAAAEASRVAHKWLAQLVVLLEAWDAARLHHVAEPLQALASAAGELERLLQDTRSFALALTDAGCAAQAAIGPLAHAGISPRVILLPAERTGGKCAECRALRAAWEAFSSDGRHVVTLDGGTAQVPVDIGPEKDTISPCPERLQSL
jgi:hypothetical protein